MARTYTELYRFVGEIRLTKDQWYDLKYLAISFTEKESTDESPKC